MTKAVIKDWFVTTTYAAYCLLTGRARFLEVKREYHREREALERATLLRAEAEPSLLMEGRCPTCGEREASWNFRNRVGFCFSRCAKDGSVFMDPVPSEDLLAELYNDPAENLVFMTQARERSSTYTPPDSQELTALLRMAGGSILGGRLLDVGCATGDFLLASRGVFEVEGVEISAASAAVARQRGIPVTIGTLADVPDDERFDVISLLQVVEHLREPLPVLRQAWTRLRPGGLLFLSTPAIDSFSFEYLGSDHIHVSSFGHVSLFSKVSLRELTTRAGFEVVSQEEFGGVDLSLHDLVGRLAGRERFRHRMALYSPRLYYSCELARRLSFGALDWVLSRKRAQSYQRVLARKP